MTEDMFARKLTVPPEVAELMKPYTPKERVGVIDTALGSGDRTGGKLGDKNVSINRTDSGYTVTWEKAADTGEGATYTYDRDGNHLKTDRCSQTQPLLDPNLDKGDIILRQLGKLEKTT
jgi:hypothetical protein